jgi:hypothetical protein
MIQLRYGSLDLTSVSESPIAASVDLTQDTPTLIATAPAKLQLSDGRLVPSL